MWWKLTCTPIKEYREATAGEGTQTILCWATPSPIAGTINLPEAHLHKPTEVRGHKGRQEQKLRTQRKGHPVQTPPGAVPRNPHMRGPDVTHIKSIFQNCGGCCYLGVCKALWDSTMGCVEEKSKAGKGTDLSNLVRNEHEEMEGIKG